MTNAVTVGTISSGVINAASFHADVGSTTYASNNLAKGVDKAIKNHGSATSTELSTTESNIRGTDADDLTVISGEIAGLNNVSKAEVNAEAAAALATYGAATATNVSTSESNIRGTDSDDLKDVSDEIAGLNNVSTTDVQSSATASLNAYDPPTEAEMNAKIDALNNVSTADVRTQADAALTAYDPPTKTEMDAKIDALNNVSTVDVRTQADAASAAALDNYDPPTHAELTAETQAAKLDSDGLDAIATTAPTGPATTFREMVVQGWRRLFKKTALTKLTSSTGELTTYADDGVTAITTQSITDDGTTQTSEDAA